MKDWGNLELEKKGDHWRVAAGGIPAIVLVLFVAAVGTYYLLGSSITIAPYSANSGTGGIVAVSP